MVILEIKNFYWNEVHHHIITRGRMAPLSLQWDVDVTCAGTDYVLKVQHMNKRRIAVLQALQVCSHSRGDRPEYQLVDDTVLLRALFEMLVRPVCGGADGSVVSQTA